MGSNTNIPKTFSSGFILSEQELRRLVKIASEQIEKNGVNVKQRFEATLLDHSVVETDNVEEILTLENGGAKSVASLEVDISSECDSSKIAIGFQDGEKNSKSWNSISLTVNSDDRDWAFLTASELEDRISRLKFFSFPHWWSKSIYSTILYGLVIVALLWGFNTYVAPDLDKPGSLRVAYENGEIANAIEALIHLEELKRERSPYYYLGLLVVLIVAPILISRFLSWISSNLYKSYVFYWGDQIAKHDKAMGRLKVFCVAIVLGVLASVIGGVLLKAVGIG